MELGATVCKPANPACGACPVASVCEAARLVAAHAEAGGDPEAEGVPKATDFPEKARIGACRGAGPGAARAPVSSPLRPF
jgi:adenine-specific DNA glycosylase